MYKNMNRNKKKSGFTLIEMSIVLVIIGLIVGGVLTGQDLIKAAQIRATVTQIGNYDAALNTFRTKYNCIPGDCVRAEAFGVGDSNGDGDGLIEGVATTFSEFDGDISNLWDHLSQAALVPGTYTWAGNVAATPHGAGTNFPSIKLGNNGLIVYTDSGKHYYYLGVMGTTDADLTMKTGPSLAPVEAYGIDNKLDDGLPHSGTTQSREGVVIDSLPAAGNDCDTGVGGDYDLTTEALECQLRIRASM